MHSRLRARTDHADGAIIIAATLALIAAACVCFANCCKASRRCACLTMLMIIMMPLMCGTAALAEPGITPFLSVDIDGYNAGSGQSIGPTEAGFHGWEAVEGLFLPPEVDWGNSGAAGLTQVFPTSQGNVTANMRGIVPDSFRGARNRGASANALTALYQDWVFAGGTLDGLGQNYIAMTVSGLTPGEVYQVTTYAYDQAFASTDSFQAWTDRAALGGLDGPGAWMDANIAPGAFYQPAAGGVNNPIPTLARSQSTGPNSPNPLAYAATFLSAADGSGVVTFYGWADPNTFTGTQRASLLGGFQIAQVPEPAVASALLALVGVVSGARRRRVVR